MGGTQDSNWKIGEWQSTWTQQGAAKCIQVAQQCRYCTPYHLIQPILGRRSRLRRMVWRAQQSLFDWMGSDQQNQTTSDNEWVEQSNFMGVTQDSNCKIGKWQSTRTQQGAAKRIQVAQQFKYCTPSHLLQSILGRRSRLRRMVWRTTSASTKKRRPLRPKQVARSNTNGHRVQSIQQHPVCKTF